VSHKLPADVTAGEEELLALMLREMRHAASMGLQLSMIFDPWIVDSLGTRKAVGANISMHFNGSGYSSEALGVRKQASRRPGARPASKR